MKGINAWAKELKHNEKFARKFECVQTVQDILNLAKKNGYYFTAEELKNCDLNSVTGGAGAIGDLGNVISSAASSGCPSAGNITVNPNINPNINTDININKISNAATATAEHATAQSNPNINILNSK